MKNHKLRYAKLAVWGSNDSGEAGFAKTPSFWLFASARDYEGESGEIETCFSDS